MISYKIYINLEEFSFFSLFSSFCPKKSEEIFTNFSFFCKIFRKIIFTVDFFFFFFPKKLRNIYKLFCKIFWKLAVTMEFFFFPLFSPFPVFFFFFPFLHFFQNKTETSGRNLYKLLFLFVKYSVRYYIFFLLFFFFHFFQNKEKIDKKYLQNCLILVKYSGKSSSLLFALCRFGDHLFWLGDLWFGGWRGFQSGLGSWWFWKILIRLPDT